MRCLCCPDTVRGLCAGAAELPAATQQAAQGGSRRPSRLQLESRRSASPHGELSKAQLHFPPKHPSCMAMTTILEVALVVAQTPGERGYRVRDAACACTGVDAGTPFAARVLAEAAAAEPDQRARGFAGSPGAPTPARMASPVTAMTPGSGLVRTAQACRC